jgi:hypothetical protein
VVHPDNDKAYNGKRFVVLLFLGFVLFAILMGSGTFLVGQIFRPDPEKARPRPLPATSSPDSTSRN